MILLGIDDMKTLLLSQRVNKDFEATIGGSLPLQQALFFKPLLEEVSNPAGDHHNPFLSELSLPDDGQDTVKISSMHRSRFSRRRRRDCMGNKTTDSDYHIIFNTTKIAYEDEEEWLRTKCVALPTVLPQPSCYRMLLQQPQTESEVTVWVSSRDREGQRRSLARFSVVLTVAREDTMGDLLSKLKEKQLVDRNKYKQIRKREDDSSVVR